MKMKVADREVNVYLPLMYDRDENSYPVVYVQDGGNLIRGCINYLDHLVITRQLDEIIYVGIETSNRIDDYSPWPASALVVKKPDFAGRGKEYLQELVERIKPAVDHAFRTRTEAEVTGIAGYSLGGLISIYAAYVYPEVFGRFGLLSASFWYFDFLKFMEDRPLLEAEFERKFYMYVGAKEGIYKESAQQDMVANTVVAYERLIARGCRGNAVHLAVDQEGTHDMMFFLQQFPKALQWMFSK